VTLDGRNIRAVFHSEERDGFLSVSFSEKTTALLIPLSRCVYQLNLANLFGAVAGFFGKRNWNLL